MTHKLERFVDALAVYNNPSAIERIADDKNQLITEYNTLENHYDNLLDDAECVLCYFLDKPDLDPNRLDTWRSLLAGERTQPPKYTKKDFLVAYERLVKTIQSGYEEAEDE